MGNKHKWIKSTLGHGNFMCSKCFITDLEAQALDCYEICNELSKQGFEIRKKDSDRFGKLSDGD